MGIIYKITCEVTGKSYIGKTIQPLKNVFVSIESITKMPVALYPMLFNVIIGKTSMYLFYGKEILIYSVKWKENL
jgi:hypothetical protein